MDLAALGWDDFFAAAFSPHQERGWIPARVAVEQRGGYRLYSAEGEMAAQLSGKFRHQLADRTQLPAVGDWVAVSASGQMGLIHALLPRKSRFVRRAPVSGGRKVRHIGGREIVAGGATEAQVVAANIDTALFMAGLDDNFNLRRIERFLTLVQSSGANPAIVLNKADLAAAAPYLAQVEKIAAGVPIHALSALEGCGLEQLVPYLTAGRTAAFIGSSGVGKSTLVNALLGQQRQAVQTLSQAVGKGRHTTSHRELIVLPVGGVIVDTPGMRELQIWGDERDLQQSFADIEALIGQCRYTDCRHQDDPGCAVRQGLESGALDNGRYQSYLRQKGELAYLAQRQQEKKRRVDKGQRRSPGKGRDRPDW
ncbi:MAG: ribosome small subunit-dependent GTPase A [Candidatus Latescibacteria bacterium]|nr:ribosome small subunit-dependent GTPase A [Candidatus Latescibacterota bacterium]